MQCDYCENVNQSLCTSETKPCSYNLGFLLSFAEEVQFWNQKTVNRIIENYNSNN